MSTSYDCFPRRIFRADFDYSTGSAIPNVKGVKDLKAIPLPVPSMAEKQLEVLERLEELLNHIRGFEIM